MPLNHRTTRVFYKWLYRTEMITITLLKRNDDQQQGTVAAYKLFNCLLPQNEVSGRFIAGSKAFYSGEAIEFTTASGATLLCTVNHPILTTHGFVAAHQINKGNDLVADVGGEVVSKNVKDSPSLIEKVFQTLLEKSNGLTTRMTKSLDFHGDGDSIKGNVDVVNIGRQLLRNRELQFSQTGSNGIFYGSDLLPVLVEAESQSSPMFFSFDNQFQSIYGGLVSEFSLFQRHLCPFDLFSFANGSENPVIQQYLSNGCKTSRELFDDVPNGFSRRIGFDDFFGMEMGRRFSSQPHPLGASSRFNVHLFESGDKRNVVDAQLFGQLSSRFPGQVALDKVVGKKLFHYDGPVFDLETEQGYFTASTNGNKLIVSNCRFSDLRKKGRAIQGEMSSVFYSRLYIPDRELARVNIQYLNVLDRIIDTKNRTWQPESGELIDDKTFENMWGVDVLMLDGRSQS